MTGPILQAMQDAPPAAAPASSPGRVAGNTLARAAGEVLAKLASLTFYVVMARKLGTSDYGAFVFALALTSALLIASGFGTDELVARQVSRVPTSAGFHLANVTALKALTAVALLGVSLAVVWVGGYPASTRLATLLIGIGAALEVAAKSWHAIFQARERLELVSACLIVQRTVTAAVGIAILLAGGGLIGAACAYLLGSAVGLGCAELALRRFAAARRPRPSIAAAWDLLRAGVPIGLAGLLLVIMLRVDVVLLSLLGDNTQVGLYAAGYRLVEGLQFVTWSFGAAMLPWLARARPGPRLARGYMLGLKLEAGVLLPLGLVLACFAGPIVQFLYGPAFAGAATPLTLLGGTVVLYGLQSFSSTVLIARDSPGAIARAAGVVAIQNVACNLVAIPLAGARGAAAVALSSSLLLAAATVWLSSRRTGGLPLARAFAGPALAGVALVVAALALPLPPVPAAALALIAYGGVLAAVELGVHRDDVRSYGRALPAPVRARLALR
jgi:O-antigen/teichoic acid export membrane protein